MMDYIIIISSAGYDRRRGHQKGRKDEDKVDESRIIELETMGVIDKIWIQIWVSMAQSEQKHGHWRSEKPEYLSNHLHGF